MTDVLKGVLAGAWTWLLAFVFPSALFLGVLDWSVKLSGQDIGILAEWKDWAGDSRIVAAGFAAATLGMVLLGLNTALLRVLEGYIGIRQIAPLYERMRSRQAAKKQNYRDELERRKDEGLDAGFLIEKLMRYPSADNQMAPTRFGNVIRSAEMYGAQNFCLDSQTMWNELLSCAPEPLREEQSSARSYVDMLANLLFLSAVIALVAVVQVFFSWDIVWLILFFCGVALVPLWYLLCIQAADNWAGTLRAVVNLGRFPLAEAVGLEIPSALEKEQEMWREFVWLVREGPASTDPLSKFRRKS